MCRHEYGYDIEMHGISEHACLENIFNMDFVNINKYGISKSTSWITY